MSQATTPEAELREKFRENVDEPHTDNFEERLVNGNNSLGIYPADEDEAYQTPRDDFAHGCEYVGLFEYNNLMKDNQGTRLLYTVEHEEPVEHPFNPKRGDRSYFRKETFETASEIAGYESVEEATDHLFVSDGGLGFLEVPDTDAGIVMAPHIGPYRNRTQMEEVED